LSRTTDAIIQNTFGNLPIVDQSTLTLQIQEIKTLKKITDIRITRTGEYYKKEDSVLNILLLKYTIKDNNQNRSTKLIFERSPLSFQVDISNKIFEYAGQKCGTDGRTYRRTETMIITF
jgi:hypothetical protein